MHKLKISPQAFEDLAEIKDYVTTELSNPQAAIFLVSKITKRMRSLPEHLGIGAPLSSSVDIQTEYRFLVCENYLIFYRFDDINVYVSRILYNRRDYMKILF